MEKVDGQVMNEQKITSGQFGILVIFFTIGTSILITPAGLAIGAKQSAWMPACIGIGFGLLLIVMLHSLAKNFPEMTFVEYCEKILGKWLGKSVAILFVLFSFIGATTLLWVVGNFMATQVFTKTPMIAVNILFALAVVYGVRIGIQVIARSAEIYLPWIILLFSVLLLFTLKDSKIENILPVFDLDFKPFTLATLSFISITSMPLVILLMVVPRISNFSTSKKAFITGHLVGGIFLILTTLVTVLVFGSIITSLQSYPSYALAKKISVGKFLSRIEIMLAIIWIITIYYKCTLYFYAATLGLSQILNIKNYKILSFPLGLVMVAFTPELYHDTVYAAEWDVQTWIPYSFTFGVLLPLFLLIINAIKKKLAKKHSNS